MTSEQVANYLKLHPEFFEEYADLLATIFVPHPHGGRAIPISERQTLTLREKSRQLETKLKELIQFGEGKTTRSAKMLHRMTLAMIAAASLDSLLDTVYFNLREDFAVPHIALRLWNGHAGSGSYRVPVAPAKRQRRSPRASRCRIAAAMRCSIRRDGSAKSAAICARLHTSRCARNRPTASWCSPRRRPALLSGNGHAAFEASGRSGKCRAAEASGQRVKEVL